MRIGFVIEHIGALGGTERAATAVLNGLAGHPGIGALHLLEVAPVGPPVFALDPRIERTAFSAHKVSLVRAWPRLVRWLRAQARRLRLDVVVVVEATHALYAVPALAGTAVRTIVWEHFNFRADMGRRKRRLGRRLAGWWAHDVVTLTRRDVALWQDGMRVRARLTAIPNIAPPARDTTYDTGTRLAVAVGRLVPQKGFDRLIPLWARVMRDPAARDWRLAIVGDGPDRAMLLGLIEAHGLVGRVTLVPATDDIDAVYRAAGLCCFPSRFEGFGMVLVEAASWGVPAVAFDCEAGPSDIILDGETGLLVPQDHEAAFEVAVLRMIGDDALRARMSAAARTDVARFSEARVIARWCALLGLPERRDDGAVTPSIDQAGGAAHAACVTLAPCPNA
ncbi:glycosyltransferase family 4 protein [Ameyamaea chiangmaiensis]|nr:glycosyltransferase family 4 protein [Ameyamaea chiangmaiensis]